MTTAPRRHGDIRIYGTQVSVWEEHLDTPGMRAVFSALRGHFYRRGFALTLDPTVGTCIRDNYRDGRKAQLELRTETSGRTASVEFFQNVANVENRSGGRYDFDKFKRMPRDLRLMCAVEMAAAIRFLESLGYAREATLREPLALSVLARAERRDGDALTPLEQFNAHWRVDRFDRDEAGWPTAKELAGYWTKDRDGQPIAIGEMRYTYSRGRLIRGHVYPNMNGMWTMHAADGSRIGYSSARDLFSTERPDMLPRRKPLGIEETVKRLRHELERVTEKQDWRRVAALGRALVRTAGGARLHPSKRAVAA